MELFCKLFRSLPMFVYHCFDRIVIHGYLSGLSRPEQVVYFFRTVLGIRCITKEVLAQRTQDYNQRVVVLLHAGAQLSGLQRAYTQADAHIQKLIDLLEAA